MQNILFFPSHKVNKIIELQCVILILLIITFIITPSSAIAQKFSIIATVNGKSISNFAVHDRINLMVKTSGLNNSAIVREKLTGQALQSLINEELQRQDAERLGINVSEQDLNLALDDLERKNKLSTGTFRQFVKQSGISPDSLIEQIKMQILWRKIMSKHIQPKVAVSNFEVEEIIAQQTSGSEQKEVYMYEIVLPLEDGGDAATINTANELIKEIQAGADFSKIAKQFSSGSVAESGGEIGWIAENQLRGALKDYVKMADANTLLPPIRMDDGYHIIKLGDRRNMHNNAPNAPSEQKVKQYLMSQRMDLESKRYMKELRENAVIDLRQ